MAEQIDVANPNGVDHDRGRPLQGRNDFCSSRSVGFTYGYSRFPAPRESARPTSWLAHLVLGRGLRCRGATSAPPRLSRKAGSHGQCRSDRGLFSNAIAQRQAHVVNLNGACCDCGFVQGEVVETRPSPLSGPRNESFARRIHMHVVQSFSKLLFVTYETVPELVLPQRTARPSPLMQPQRHNLLRVM